MTREVVERSKRRTAHLVNIEITGQMIDFMLQNARVPAGRLDDSRVATLVEALYPDGAARGNDRRKAR